MSSDASTESKPVAETPSPEPQPTADAAQAQADGGAPEPTPAVRRGDIPEGFRITLERTACFGSCPVYKVTLDARGALVFTSKSGCATRTVPPSEVAKLASLVKSVGFFGLKAKYTANVTDHPSAYVTVAMGGRTKKVDHYLADVVTSNGGAGDATDRANLRKLEAAIDTATDAQFLATSSTLTPCKGKSASP
jgi:hypothetical protein